MIIINVSTALRKTEAQFFNAVELQSIVICALF